MSGTPCTILNIYAQMRRAAKSCYSRNYEDSYFHTTSQSELMRTSSVQCTRVWNAQLVLRDNTRRHNLRDCVLLKVSLNVSRTKLPQRAIQTAAGNSRLDGTHISTICRTVDRPQADLIACTFRTSTWTGREEVRLSFQALLPITTA